MKVFDCQDFPEDVKSAFFVINSWGNPRGNDIYVDYRQGDYLNYQRDRQNYYITDEDINCSKVVYEYLKTQSLEDTEEAIIKHWW